MLLPHSIGCQDQVVRPIALVQEEVSQGSLVYSTFFLWPYFFGFTTFVVFAAMVGFRPKNLSRILIALPILFGIYLTALWGIFFHNDDDGWALFAFVFPGGLFVLVRMVLLIRQGQTLKAAAWGQSFLCVLAIFSLRWWWMPPVKKLLYGGVLSMVAAAAMMVASWTWPSLAEHDLSDRNTPPQPMQFSLFQMIVATSIIAALITLWRFLEE
ncbi:hypothetical protein [Novipirellula artificiosorum]|nr:hypothetical protein [Novipirellula artificiosorum]